jgi:hypothetical protein
MLRLRKNNSDEINFEQMEANRQYRAQVIRKGAKFAVKKAVIFLITMPFRMIWDMVKAPFTRGDE